MKGKCKKEFAEICNQYALKCVQYCTPHKNIQLACTYLLFTDIYIYIIVIICIQYSKLYAQHAYYMHFYASYNWIMLTVSAYIKVHADILCRNMKMCILYADICIAYAEIWITYVIF